MLNCPANLEKCLNCNAHFQKLRSLVKEIIVSKHFLKDAPDFDVNLVIDCAHIHFTELHRFEESINGNFIFRALKEKTHIVYAIDKSRRLLFLRAFNNFNAYRKFLSDKKVILNMISRL